MNAPSTSSVTRRVRVTPSDTVDLEAGCRGLYVVTSGTVATMLLDESTPVTHTVAEGQSLPWQVKRVYSTGTTATVEAWF